MRLWARPTVSVKRSAFATCLDTVKQVLTHCGLRVVASLIDSRLSHAFRALLRREIAAAFLLASAFELAPHAFNDNNKRVGSPSLRSGPGMLPMRARNDARRGLSPLFTGRLRFIPWALAERLPASFKPPLGFFPALRCQAGVLISASNLS